jgi:hypothetical protein
MNKLAYVVLTALTAACANSASPITENVATSEPEADTAAVVIAEGLHAAIGIPDEEDTAIRIDSVVVERKAQEDICFQVERSTYPKISGLVDQRFEERLNQILRRNFNAHVNLAKKEFGGCPEADEEEDEDEEDDYANIYPSASGNFEVLTRNDSMVSIVQYMLSTVGYGGNSWTPSSYTLTADVKRNIVYGMKEFQMDRGKRSYLNSKIKAFFAEQFSHEAEQGSLNYPLIKTNRDFDALNFAVRNDSLMLVIAAYPSGHFSHDIYIIPIEKMPAR